MPGAQRDTLGKEDRNDVDTYLRERKEVYFFNQGVFIMHTLNKNKFCGRVERTRGISFDGFGDEIWLSSSTYERINLMNLALLRMKVKTALLLIT